MRPKSLPNARCGKVPPQCRDQWRELEDVQDQLRQSQKRVRVFYGVMSVSPYGAGDRNERNLKAVYKAAGWELQDERYLQMAGLLAVMPLTMAHGLARDFERLRRFRTMLSTTVANIAPVKGRTENDRNELTTLNHTST